MRKSSGTIGMRYRTGMARMGVGMGGISAEILRDALSSVNPKEIHILDPKTEIDKIMKAGDINHA